MRPEVHGASSRNPYRIVGYGLAVGVAVVGMVWIGTGTVKAPASPTNDSLRISSSTRDRFQEVYDLVWRADGSAGNTAVEVLFEFPGFVQRLAEYAERSGIQAAMLQAVQAESDASLVPFFVALQSNVPIRNDLEWRSMANVASDTGTYAYERFDRLPVTNEGSTALFGTLWFRRSGAEDPAKLTLTIQGIDGNTRASIFTWDVKALNLYDATPI